MRHFRKRLEATVTVFVVLLATFGLLVSSCGKESGGELSDHESLQLSGISLPSTLTAAKGAEITITGKGFQPGDLIALVLTTDAGTSYSSAITAVTETSASFLLPEEITSASYRLIVSRATEQLSLGTVMINVTVNTTIPDRIGMTVKGVVYCDGEGVPGVVVSDGYEVTVTDGDGVYYLPSAKENGYVFISVPGNYEVNTSGQLPQFFQTLSSTANLVEQKNFSLIKTDNSNHVVLALADWHLASRNNDLSQFTNKVLPDINSTIASYQAEGKKVYGLTLGDLTWDLYWYSNSFGIKDYLQYMNQVDCPVFNTIGNHDNDPYVTNDWLSELMYRMYLGPTYYSFNLGQVHYVVLDDIAWINTGGADGLVGSRNYDGKLTQNQLDWLAKDLATITDKNTPVVVGIHIPVFRRPDLDAAGNPEDAQFNLENSAELKNLLSGFKQVHILSGHTHSNYTNVSDNLVEHTTGAICGTWWWTNKTGYSGNHLSKDGSPAGYGVYEVVGTEIEWYFKGAGFAKDYQFRAYDLNTVQISAAEFAPNATEAAMAQYAGTYATSSNSNEILLHIWGYDPQWAVEMTENGTALNVTRVTAKDPLHIISYEAFRLNDGAEPTSSFITGATPNLFKATAASPSSTIQIKVTDRFGKVYAETMERPKVFSLKIQ